MGKDLTLELVRVIEAGALASGRWIGRGQKATGDGAAVDAVIIGEGEKDCAPMLYNSEAVGDADGPSCDVAVDPVDDTTRMATGTLGSLSVFAVAERGKSISTRPESRTAGRR